MIILILHLQVETFTLNPKCVKLGELYGATDPNTLEWTDGLMASAVRRFARELTAGPETQADEWDQRPPTTASMGSGYTRTGEHGSGYTRTCEHGVGLHQNR